MSAPEQEGGGTRAFPAVHPARRPQPARPAPVIGQLTVDARTADVRAGDSLLDVARRAGRDVPTACFSDGLPAEGGCRVCLVEVAGAARPAAACHTPAQPGMVVRTDTGALAALRRDILALQLHEHAPGTFLARADGSAFERLLLRCGVDPAVVADAHRGHGVRGDGIRAGAERQAARGEAAPEDAPGAAPGDGEGGPGHAVLALPGPIVAGWRPLPAPGTWVQQHHPYLRHDPGLCITCRRCLHACERVEGRFVYGIGGRGAGTRLLVGADGTFQSGGCSSCGACIEECPTGALFDRDGRRGGRSWPPDTTATHTTCGYCGVGCRLDVGVREGRVVAIGGVPGAAVNDGHLCAKGRYAHAWQTAPDRLRRPLLREGEGFREVSWDLALGHAARELLRLRAEHGPDALSVLTSSRSTNEAAYLLQRLFRAEFSTNNVDCCARVCHSSTALALRDVTGTGAATACYADIERAARLVVAGANPGEAHPVLGARLVQAVLDGARLLVIDPRRTDLAARAELHLPLRPGSNVALFDALAKLLLEEGAADAEWLAARTEGLPALAAFLAEVPLARLLAPTGLREDAVRAAARLLRQGPCLFVHGLGLSELQQGTDSVRALCNLALLTASVGVPGAGLLPLRGQNNVQGNADMGCQPDLLPGGQALDDPGAVERARRLWGRPAPARAGLALPQMLAAARRGELAALWVCGEDIVQSDPDEEGVLAALARLRLLVVQELFFTGTAARAHLVLPAAGFLEQDGTFTNAERRIQRVTAVLPPPGEARPDWQVARDLARALGADWSHEGPADVLEEIAAFAPAVFGGVRWERLGEDGLCWPCPAPDHPGTARLHADGVLRGRARFSRVAYAASDEHDVPGFPYLLVTGRVLQHYNVGTMTRRTPSLALTAGDVLEIHPDDLAREGLRDGQSVRLESRWGRTDVPVRVSGRVAPSTLFLSFHFPATHANRVVGPVADPESRCPQYKAVAVRLRPLPAPS